MSGRISSGTDYVKGSRVSHSTARFSYSGKRNLFGLPALELHTLPPELTAVNLEKTPAVACDGTHGFSVQYLVEVPIFPGMRTRSWIESWPALAKQVSA